MSFLVFSIVFFAVSLIFGVLSLVYLIKTKKDKRWSSNCDFNPTLLFFIFFLCASLVGSGLIVGGKVKKLEPDEVGIAYATDGTAINLKRGYNIVPLLAITNRWSSKSYVNTFSEGEGQDDIFGAQTSEKDYITAVATVTVRLDASRLDEYITMYGDNQINSETITKLLKTQARSAIESVISKYTTADVMGHKDQMNKEAQEAFRALMAEQPIIIDAFTLDDLVAPESYEQSILAQAELRQKTTTAELQKTLNATEAASAKIKAEGEAEVARVNAQKEADVAKLNAQKELDVATLNAEKEATTKQIAASSALEIAKIDAERVKTTAEADAEKVKIAAEAEAEATKTKGTAEAEVAQALANVYKTNPEMYQLKIAEIDADVAKTWAAKWSGLDLSGLSPTVSWADVSTMLQEILGKALD